MVHFHSSTAIVFAGSDRGEMRTDRPIVLHELCGRPMIHFVVDSLLRWGVQRVFLFSEENDPGVTSKLKAPFGDDVVVCQATEVSIIRQRLSGRIEEFTFVVGGDAPLFGTEELTELAIATEANPEKSGFSYASASSKNVDSARLARAPRVQPVVAYALRNTFLEHSLDALERERQPIAIESIVELIEQNGQVVRLRGDASPELVRVRDRVDLAKAETLLYGRIADDLRRAGATIRGNPRIDIGVIVEPDALIDDGVSLRGTTRVAKGARVDVGCVLTDVSVASNAIVKPYTVCTRASIGEAAEVGPFSHIRPDSDIQANARIGNFVETKNVVMRRGAMANHLAYLGDGDVGEGANIGAGTIFCNSDSINKHRTEVGARAFVGSDCQLVAPVRVGVGAFVATGTTVTRDIPDDALAIARVPQQNKEGYATQLRARFAALAAKAKALVG